MINFLKITAKVSENQDFSLEMENNSHDKVEVVIICESVKPLKFETLLRNDVRRLKESIDQAKIIPESQYFITLEGKFLHDDDILENVGINNGSELVINKREEINVTVKYNGDEYKLLLTQDMLISKLKVILSQKFGIDEQSLILFHDEEFCKNNYSLFELGISNSSVINARIDSEIPIQIKTNDGVSFCIRCYYLTKIKEIKEEIEKRMSSGDQYVLTYAGKFLKDDETICYYHIDKYSVIDLYVSKNCDG